MGENVKLNDSDNVKYSRMQAIDYLGISEKEFNNYLKFSKEIPSSKNNRGWFVLKKADLDAWNNLKKKRTILLTLSKYEKCFEFAIKMVYSSRSSFGTGIRGVRSEVQMADDFILGILAEHGVKKFLKEKFNIKIELDEEVHPGEITPQDIVGIFEEGERRHPKMDIAVKASKSKNCFLIIPPIEYENEDRKSDVYIFVRVGLPSDHLFRILRDHSFFKKVKIFLDESEEFRKIEQLKEIPIWITGYAYHNELIKVKEIPGQKFDGKKDVNDYRYVRNVANLHNSDEDWLDLIKKI